MQFEHEPAFEYVMLESERVRLFREYLVNLEEQCTHKSTRRKKNKKKGRSESPMVTNVVVVYPLLPACWGSPFP